MTRTLGYSAVAIALILTMYGIVAAVVGARRRRPELVQSAQLVAYVNFGLLALANLAMVYALVTRDFSIEYVAQVGSRAIPFWYAVASLWSALEGSILLWGLVLAGYTAAVVYLARGRLGELVPYATAVLLAVGAFFYFLLVGPANPFEAVWPIPPDGPGPNPLLQNHILVIIHPPLLYLGYVGLTVPFAFAVGALLSGRLDDVWIRATRRWTIIAWAFLSVAIMAGMWWSYEVLGWGGYWAWDPVENAAFLPWLTATAFLHSVMVQERRGMLRLWNLSLIVSTFLLSILGTFLTRSGIVSSVHSFTQGTIGYYYLGFIAVALLFSIALLAGRSQELRSEGSLEDPVSRESVFLLNNLLLVAFTFTVLLGTLFPLVAEAVRGVKVSVGAPFYNRMTLPICVALIFLMGVGPALPWRSANRERLTRDFLLPAVALVVVAVAAVTLGTRNPYTVAAFAFGAFALTVNVRQFVAGAAARMRAHGEGALQALGRLIGANRRRYGGYVAHIGIITMAVAIAASSTFSKETARTLRPGERLAFEGYELRFDELWGREEPRRTVIGADVTLFRDGRELGTIVPRMNFYQMSSEPIVTPAVRTRPHSDLYVNLMSFEAEEAGGTSATLQVLLEPLVVWIWIGGGIIGLGALIAVWPARRRPVPTQARSGEREGAAGAAATTDGAGERRPARVGV